MHVIPGSMIIIYLSNNATITNHFAFAALLPIIYLPLLPPSRGSDMSRETRASKRGEGSVYSMTIIIWWLLDISGHQSWIPGIHQEPLIKRFTHRITRKRQWCR